MTHVIALEAGQSSQGTSEPISPVLCVFNILRPINDVIFNRVSDNMPEVEELDTRTALHDHSYLETYVL